MGKAEGRRRAILERLWQVSEPISGAELAKQLGVSRQVIVQDIAILRASGQAILATPQGYLFSRAAEPQFACRRVVAVSHSAEGIELELKAVAEMGGRVLDVVVEHPIYGEIRGLVMTQSQADVQEFMQRLKNSKAAPLLTLTGGPHLHTLEAPTEERLDRITNRLQELGFLLRS